MANKNNYDLIIWDWNGTLLDDVFWCIKTMNQMLQKRGLPLLQTKERYHEVFCFPIRQYYANIGFNFEKESFENLAKEYISLHHSENSRHSQLHKKALCTVANIKLSGIAQIILSASQANNLQQQLEPFDIADYFDAVLGIEDIYANSKIDLAKTYLSQHRARRILCIGDTVHDYEVAQSLNADCLLIANGHQSKATLADCGVPVLQNIQAVLDYV